MEVAHPATITILRLHYFLCLNDILLASRNHKWALGREKTREGGRGDEIWNDNEDHDDGKRKGAAGGRAEKRQGREEVILFF